MECVVLGRGGTSRGWAGAVVVASCLDGDWADDLHDPTDPFILFYEYI